MRTYIGSIVPALALLFPVCSGTRLAAQEFRGCTVTYQQTTRYDFASIFGTFDNPEYNQWVASLPRQHEEPYVLYATPERSLYTKAPNTQDNPPEVLQQALQKADYFQAPGVLVRQVYHDFSAQERISQVEFMTRLFNIAGPMESCSWKLTGKMTKILDYVCAGAEMKEGDSVVSAWFTSEIPVSAGPSTYTGLPGLILALEINGETAYLATAADPAPPQGGLLIRPEQGTNVTPEEFAAIRAEKLKEWKETGSKGTSTGKK
ncbi:GLPGLI family protein [bacterium]|nr:GLPGLI family protein [bacterium]